jgi:hypothetical protein
MNKLWFILSVIALTLAANCFHLHEERHRFVKVGEVGPAGAMVVMFDRKTRNLCVSSFPSESMNKAQLCSTLK